jgi:hypothetical protein
VGCSCSECGPSVSLHPNAAPAGAMPYNKTFFCSNRTQSCYHFEGLVGEARVTWPTAVAKCAAMGASLVTYGEWMSECMARCLRLRMSKALPIPKFGECCMQIVWTSNGR